MAADDDVHLLVARRLLVLLDHDAADVGRRVRVRPEALDAEAAADLAAFLTKPVKLSQLYDVLVAVFAAGHPAPQCDPHHPEDTRPPDPRLVRIVLTDFNAWGNGSGAPVNVPIIALAAFYVTGWEGANGGCTSSNDSRWIRPAPRCCAATRPKIPSTSRARTAATTCCPWRTSRIRPTSAPSSRTTRMQCSRRPRRRHRRNRGGSSGTERRLNYCVRLKTQAPDT